MNNINLERLYERIYYSQNREDLILETFFPEETNGFYVDVGGFDPDYDSVTKRFYMKGWRGINIEPQPNRYNFFVNKRKRDTNINCGVADEVGEQILRVYNSGGRSTFSENIKNTYAGNITNETKRYEDIKVPIRTLRDIFTEYEVSEISFLKVDVEGFEYQVLQGNDWKKFRPEVICIETDHMVSDWRPLLKDCGYELAFFDGLNNYYCSKESKRKQKFDYNNHMIVRMQGGIRYEDYKIIKRLSQSQSILDGKVTKLGQYRKENERLVKRNIQLESEINNPKFLLKRLLDLSRQKTENENN